MISLLRLTIPPDQRDKAIARMTPDQKQQLASSLGYKAATPPTETPITPSSLYELPQHGPDLQRRRRRIYSGESRRCRPWRDQRRGDVRPASHPDPQRLGPDARRPDDGRVSEQTLTDEKLTASSSACVSSWPRRRRTLRSLRDSSLAAWRREKESLR